MSLLASKLILLAQAIFALLQIKSIPKLFVYLTLFLNGANALASERSVLAIVSDRSAPALVAGAHQLLQQNPSARIEIRTSSQLNELSDTALQSLIAKHDTLLFTAVFGDPISRLVSLHYPANQRRFIIHSDRRLMTLNANANGAIFSSQQADSLIGNSHTFRDLKTLAARQQASPGLSDWLQIRAYWVNRSARNARHLFDMLISGEQRQAAVEAVAPIRFMMHSAGEASVVSVSELRSALKTNQPTLWILDHDTGDLGNEWSLHRQVCTEIKAQCVSVLAAWGKPSVNAVRQIQTIRSGQEQTAWAILSLQDFVIGGGDGRQTVEELLTQIDIPVLKGLRLSDWTATDHQLSAKGIPSDSVHYRIAMPELQGVSQPHVLSVSIPSKVDPQTGARLSRSQTLKTEISRQVQRIERWLNLQRKTNAEKRVAIIYYNHPPGRHNIGADNLNVPDSLLQILRELKAAGYRTGELPENSEALLDLLQQRGVNLPEDAQALAKLSEQAETLSTADYQRWFESLPAVVQAEMINGPLAALQQKLETTVADALTQKHVSLRQTQLKRLKDYMHNTLADLHHALDGLRHKGRERALDLLDQLESAYAEQIDNASQSSGTSTSSVNWSGSRALSDALLAMRIEGIRGWGKAPGQVMVWQNEILIPGLRFGNVFIGPQPPRGWEINEELLHANLSFPPPHQYLGFYHYLKSVFKADALVHVGRHSTYEFLPKRSVCIGMDDYPAIVAGDLPGIYPYIVDGVGEGIQAKRRGLAVVVDHLTPPLAATELYDDLLHLRQLIESAEAATDEATHQRAVETLRKDIDRLGLREELIASMDEELKVRGVGFDAIDDHFLLHEVGHYLTNIQESFMPLGLHVFGQDWSDSAVDTMLQSMLDGSPDADQDIWKTNLKVSPAAEMAALLNGLNGRFVAPGKGNDPIRTPEALPTGRNFYALDGSLLPTRVGYDIGRQLAVEVLSNFEPPVTGRDTQGVILWASDAVRDEGAMIAFGMKLLGVKPIWNSRGIIKGIERLALSAEQPHRLDVLFTTSGLFRDLYGEHLVLLDKASLMALDASADLIKQQYPALTLALDAALAPLGAWRQGGSEPLSQNRVAAHWLEQARQSLAQKSNLSAQQLGRQASLRVFGIAPGSYGAGINRLAERSGAWEQRSELADVFIKRMGHAYGAGLNGEATQVLFRQQLAQVSHTFLGRASNLYGLIDNNDAFDYLGGFNLAIENVSGKQPDSSVIDHANNKKLKISPLSDALLSELRGRFLNPQWIKPLMQEGYAGARTMGSEFIEYLWGWQVTSPEIINDAVWERVKAVYIDDKLNLGLDDFLAQGHRQHVQSNILAVMLVAIDKGFWQAEPATVQQLAEQFADNILRNGLPGSGHTHPEHPMYELVKAQLTSDQSKALEQLLNRSRVQKDAPESAPSHIQEINMGPHATERPKGTDKQSSPTTIQHLQWLVLLAVALIGAGIIQGRRGQKL